MAPTSENEFAAPPSLNSLKKSGGTTVLCCTDISPISIQGQEDVISDRVREIIEPLVTEFKSILTKDRPLKAAPFVPKKFPYVVEVALRVPSDGHPSLQLAPQRPWSWFVPMQLKVSIKYYATFGKPIHRSLHLASALVEVYYMAWCRPNPYRTFGR
jgi:hypothetical protein